MNPIDKMLLDHANKIEIRPLCSPKAFEVIFSSRPSDQALKPLLQLIDTDRFEFYARTKDDLQSKRLDELLSFQVIAVNLIPASDAIAALAQMWRDAGYSVAINGQAQANDEPKQAIVEL